jgi:signal transduction histidine kinase
MHDFRARFLNVAAHELKTPLTPIGLQLHLLRERLKDTPDERVRRALGILARSLDRLNQLMEDVLDSARIQADQLRLKREPVDLRALVSEALDTYADVAHEVGVRLTRELASGVWVSGDPRRLLQVANNLLSNAVKFTPAKGTIHASLAAEGGMAVLRVRDTGRGLDAGQVGRLFQPFVQVHPDLEATSHGTGLGLYIVKAMVEQHGGSIAIASPGPEQGTTLTVRLPLADPGASAAKPPATKHDALGERLRSLI